MSVGVSPLPWDPFFPRLSKFKSTMERGRVAYRREWVSGCYDGIMAPLTENLNPQTRRFLSLAPLFSRNCAHERRSPRPGPARTIGFLTDSPAIERRRHLCRSEAKGHRSANHARCCTTFTEYSNNQYCSNFARLLSAMKEP